MLSDGFFVLLCTQVVAWISSWTTSKWFTVKAEKTLPGYSGRIICRLACTIDSARYFVCIGSARLSVCLSPFARSVKWSSSYYWIFLPVTYEMTGSWSLPFS